MGAETGDPIGDIHHLVEERLMCSPSRVFHRPFDEDHRETGSTSVGLADHAVLEMTGTTTWFSGKTTCVPVIAAQAIGRPGDWRMLALRANGQLAAAAYHRGIDGKYHAFAVVVLATTSTQLTRISLFADPLLFPRFDLPPTLPATG